MTQGTVRVPIQRAIKWRDIDIADAESVRMLLRGDSVVDWQRLHLSTHESVDRFLRANEYNPKNESDMVRLENIRRESVNYLEHYLGVHLAEEVSSSVNVRDLFLIASTNGPNQRSACITLKVMHIINHLKGREALMALPVSDDEIFRGVEFRVITVVEELRAAGHSISEFAWSRKPLDSQITKLLVKKSNLAARLYDRLRFRLICATKADVVPTMAALTRHLLPFNYTIPGESVNTLLDLEQELNDHLPGDIAQRMQPLPYFMPQLVNTFSAPSYQIINFVTDMPVRIDSILPEAELAQRDFKSSVVFVQTEFQIVDEETAVTNETGESSHKSYKQRQRNTVCLRLMGSKAPPSE